MKKFDHVEDYIEVITGLRNPVTGQLEQLWAIATAPILSLARYDTSVLDNLAMQGLNKVAYTDRQAKLATDLVLKYERQLYKHGVDISPVKEKPEFRMPLRVLDRSQRVWIEDELINIRFPYVPALIDSIRAECKDSKGSIQFNRDKKVWQASLTEHNVNWAYTFSTAHQFDVDPTMQQAMDLLLAAEAKPYAIELKATADHLQITNAPTALQEYVEQNLGGFELDNLLPLVDAAPILGYTVEKIIEEAVIETYGTRFYSLCNNRELKIDLTSVRMAQIEAIVQYARTTNRFPIFVYEPDLSNQLCDMFIRQFSIDEVVNLDVSNQLTPDTKLVYTGRIPRTPFERIPLLVSAAGMIFGGDRQLWLQTAEKIVYFSKEVYNKSTVKKGTTLCKLS